MTREAIARKASADSRDLRDFMGFEGTGDRFTGASLQREAILVNIERSGNLPGHTLWGKVKGMIGEKEATEVVVSERKRKGWKIQGIRRSNPDKKNGPDPKEIADPDWARVLDGASLGIPFERLCHLAGMSEKTFAKYLLRHPDRKEAIEAAKTRGEYDLTSVVRNCGPGWQGSAWLLERTRGYVARAQLDHTSKGKELSISGNLLGAFGVVSKA